MKQRPFGNSELQVSVLGFGCGAVGGLLVRGDYKEMVRTVEYAVQSGITYFDTAAIYGNGVSETNLGRVLEELKPDVVVGTKVRLTAEDLDDIPAAVRKSIEASLQRLRMDNVDLIQLHNPLAKQRNIQRGWISVDDALLVAEAMQELVQQGKARLWGINGLGETKAIHNALADGKPDTIQCCINMLNPSAVVQAPAGYAFQDYERLAHVADEQGTKVIAIRVLAGGAVSGTVSRHPNAADQIDPIATNAAYEEDAAYALRFMRLVDDGHVESLIEAAIRYVVYADDVTTALVGISSYEQLAQAVTFTERGPLSADALALLAEIQGL